MGENEQAEQELRAALDAMEAAYGQASDAIESIPDPQQAYERAGVLREAADQLVGLAAELRARMVGRIWDAEEMSLATLAERIGVSKSRADQFLRTARAAKDSRRVGIVTDWFLPPSEDAVEHRVAICGSRATGTDEQIINDTIRSLGGFLTQRRCRVTHGPVGVGIEVMTHISDHYRPPGLGTVTGIFGRPNILRDADYVLVVGGGQGTQVEVDLAVSMGKRIIPMPASGGTAAHTYMLLQREPDLRRWMPEATFVELATAEADEFTRVLRNILSASAGSDDAGDSHE